MEDDSLGNVNNARTAAQAEQMERTIGQGECPFCKLDTKINRVMLVGRYFRAWENPYPYPHHSAHLVLASIAHWMSPADIPADAWVEWGQMNVELIQGFNLPGGGLVMRFGENSHNGGTLTHLHSHIQVSDKSGPSIAVFFKDERLKRFLASLKK